MRRDPEICPVCGRPTTEPNRIRAWPGTWAHRDCASYSRRRSRPRGSHRVHDKFTRR